MKDAHSKIRKKGAFVSGIIIFILLSCNNLSSKKNYYGGTVTQPAGKGSIEGYVLNVKDEIPVVGAMVKLSNGMSMISDSQGHYSFTEISAGRLDVQIEADGFLRFLQQVYVYKGQSLKINFKISPIPGPGVSVTVATFNVRDFEINGYTGNDPNQNVNYSNVAKFIKDSNVDIIVFQEIQPDDEIALKSELANIDVTMSAVEFNNESYEDHISAWSKYPVTETASILKGSCSDPITKDDVFAPRYIFKFKVIIDSHEIWFYGCHLKAGGGDDDLKKRRAQSYALSEYIKLNHYEESENIIILGDINTAATGDFIEGGTLDYLSLRNDNLDNIFNDFVPMNYTYLPHDDYTFDNYYFQSLLDHIIISPALLDNYIDNSIDVVHPEGDPSDHYPVLLKLYFEL